MSGFNVVRFRVGGRYTGAHFYEKMVERAIQEYPGGGIEYRSIFPEKRRWHTFRLTTLFLYWVKAQFELLFGDLDVAIVSPGSFLYLPSRITVICIAHHYDPSVFSAVKYIYAKLGYYIIRLQRHKISCLVTGAIYWQGFYREAGFKNVRVIYSSFDVKQMLNAETELGEEQYLKKMGLKPGRYIHLGSYGNGKGQDRVCDRISHLGYQLIATTSNPVLNQNKASGFTTINASINEYNILLKNAAVVVAMSEFKEGWCRVLHEAAIHGTPILGSGAGGMTELLAMANTKPSTLRSLKSDVAARIVAGRLEKKIVSDFREFNVEQFCASWVKIFSEYKD